ncbi:MAG: hypothetical protein ACJA0C_000055 [Candidatus Endobugula sp.]|jgi:hypothetical protein
MMFFLVKKFFIKSVVWGACYFLRAFSERDMKVRILLVQLLSVFFIF